MGHPAWCRTVPCPPFHISFFIPLFCHTFARAQPPSSGQWRLFAGYFHFLRTFIGIWNAPPPYSHQNSGNDSGQKHDRSGKALPDEYFRQDVFRITATVLEVTTGPILSAPVLPDGCHTKKRTAYVQFRIFFANFPYYGMIKPHTASIRQALPSARRPGIPPRQGPAQGLTAPPGPCPETPPEARQPVRRDPRDGLAHGGTCPPAGARTTTLYPRRRP